MYIHIQSVPYSTRYPSILLSTGKGICLLFSEGHKAGSCQGQHQPLPNVRLVPDLPVVKLCTETGLLHLREKVWCNKTFYSVIIRRSGPSPGCVPSPLLFMVKRTVLVSADTGEGQVAVSGVCCLSIVRGDCRPRFDVHASPEAVAGPDTLQLA